MYEILLISPIEHNQAFRIVLDEFKGSPIPAVLYGINCAQQTRQPVGRNRTFGSVATGPPVLRANFALRPPVQQQWEATA
jgi:hypothetical protein